MKVYETLQALTLDISIYVNGILYTNPLAANRLLSSSELDAEVDTITITEPRCIRIQTRKEGTYGRKVKS